MVSYKGIYMRKKRVAVTLMQTMLIVGIVFLVLFMILAVPMYNSYKQKKAVYSFLNTLTYFTPYLSINNYCKESQEQCWKTPQYKDLKNTRMYDKSKYSIILADKTVLGFFKNKNGLISLIVDIDGPVGVNRLGRDVFVFYFYNNRQRPKLCPEKVYNEHYIAEGMHLGGYDKCGIPHDRYTLTDFYQNKFEDGCSKKSKSTDDGVGLGAACGALISKSGWVIDKSYPW